jgi:glycosyltransferase involved in cell wall biosynthesis
MPLTYSFVIPAYNESVRLRPTLDEILRYNREAGWDAEVIVVNDGSTDETAQIVREYGRLYPQVGLVENPGNRGKGYSVRNGMLHARGDICLFMDADLSSPMSEAPKLFDAIAQGADIAIGSRWLRTELQTERQPVYRQVFGRIFNLALRVILGLRFADTQCGFKAFRREAAQLIFPLQKIDSIRRSYFWRSGRDCASRRCRCCGPTARGRGCIPCAMDCTCSLKFCGSAGMR